ncbi:hypothetical protein [Hymenobacter actinosclerus]|uniref:Dolichyl-phosphate-mannose-protein mannosyltransferase n=1 Tax=Hymenobacter actinosclerus TaxID=82805 RepID=A0A1I0GJJ3_9BACT|nr:hypothetical protein [Hymenobacter actinosclerus]SET71313.1 hypothetical protein SAMN04487998_2454 [Hymenobacter actinosclerus]
MQQLPTPAGQPALQPLLNRLDWYWMAGVAALYLVYLPFSGYTQQYFDAQNYWELPARFITPERNFSLLHYSSLTRGYAWPLVLAPWRAAWKLLGGNPMLYIQVLGSLVAALCYGWLGPRCWQLLRGNLQPPGPVARLAFVLTGFAFWRDYFNFALTDFPALVLLLSALMLVARGLRPGPAPTWPALRWWLLAGSLLGLACNFRGIYTLSIYPVLLAAAWPTLPGAVGLRGAGGRVAALLLGGVLVLAPQYLISQRHGPPGSSWHLSGVLNQDELVKRHLGQGIQHFRYEANIGTDYPEARVWLVDPVGRALAQRHTISPAGITPAAYLGLALRYPLEFGSLLTQRLFSGLDLQQPGPYYRQLYTATWPLAAANYTLLGLGLLVLGRLVWRARHLPLRRALLAVALLLPALGALPVALESRFLLPLHVGLCMAATLGFPAAWQPARLGRTLRPLQGALLLGLYASWLALNFTFSSYTHIHLQYGGRLLSDSEPVLLDSSQP